MQKAASDLSEGPLNQPEVREGTINSYTRGIPAGLSCSNTSYSMVYRYFAPLGVGKNTSNEQNVRSYYMLNHRIRDLLFHRFSSTKFGSVFRKFARPYFCPVLQCNNVAYIARFFCPNMVKRRNSGIINSHDLSGG